MVATTIKQIETPKIVSVYTPLLTVESYLSQIERGEILMPPFKRTKQWDENLMRQYVEGVINGTGQVSMIIVGRAGDDKYIIVDGLNRTRALLAFKESKLKAFGKTITEDKELEMKFLKAQLVVSFVTVAEVKDLINLFATINTYVARPMFTDVFFAYKMLNRKLQIIDDFADKIAQLAEVTGKDIHNPRMYALYALFFYLRRTYVDRPGYGQLIGLLQYSEEEIMKATEYLLNLFKYYGLPKQHELNKLILSSLGYDVAEMRLAKKVLRGKLDEEVGDPLEAMKAAICLSAKTSRTQMFTVNVQTLVRATRTSRRVAGKLVDELILRGACSKVSPRKARLICDKSKVLEMCLKSFKKLDEIDIHEARGKEITREVGEKSTR